MLRRGNSVEVNVSESLKWAKMSSKQNDPIGTYNLAAFYLLGLGDIKKDKNKAIELFSQALDGTRKLATNGDWRAQSNLGSLYEKGYGVPQDPNKAVGWFSKAAEQGYAHAQCNLAWYYEEGSGGVPQDSNKAVEWYSKAAEQGDATGQLCLGNMYHLGLGIPQNQSKGLALLHKSAEQGNLTAMNNIGGAYFTGNGVQQNVSKAIEWWFKAAEQGFAVSQNALGDVFGLALGGVPLNYSKSIEWYTKAAEQGHVMAKNNLKIVIKKRDHKEHLETQCKQPLFLFDNPRYSFSETVKIKKVIKNLKKLGVTHDKKQYSGKNKYYRVDILSKSEGNKNRNILGLNTDGANYGINLESLAFTIYITSRNKRPNKGSVISIGYEFHEFTGMEQIVFTNILMSRLNKKFGTDCKNYQGNWTFDSGDTQILNTTSAAVKDSLLSKFGGNDPVFKTFAALSSSPVLLIKKKDIHASN